MDKSFIEQLQDERGRQILKEGFGAAHDDEHKDGELARAAVVYALPPGYRKDVLYMNLWPWSGHWFKPAANPDRPQDRQRELIKAAALIYAEWDRLERLRIIKESISEREEP